MAYATSVMAHSEDKTAADLANMQKQIEVKNPLPNHFFFFVQEKSKRCCFLPFSERRDPTEEPPAAARILCDPVPRPVQSSRQGPFVPFFFFSVFFSFFQPHTSHFVASAALQNQKADTPTPPDATGMVSEQKKKIEGIKNKKLQLEKLLSEGSLSLVPLRTVHLSSDLNCGGVVMI